MNILHTETLKRWGGQQNRVLTESIGLGRRGHYAVIACQKGSVLAEKANKAGIHVYELNMGKGAYLKTIPQLTDIIRRENIDIVSTHSSVDSWAGGIAAKLTGRKLVRFRHNIYLIGRGPLAKLIYTMPDGFIVTGRVVKDILMNRGVEEKKISVIPSSVDIERYNAQVIKDIRKETGIPADALVIGNTSTFADVKGQEFLFQAFNIIHRHVPSFMLFAGSIEEPFRSQYLSHVNTELRDKVVFLGHRDDIPRVLKTIDIFVFPSVIESTSTALLEAMAMEKPIAISDIPALRDVVIDKETGLFFKVENPQDIAEKVLFLMRNTDMKERLGRNARDTIMERFTIDRMLDLTETRYREVFNAV
jgi:glycosyltransferase involved in cell wall biosynthesis